MALDLISLYNFKLRLDRQTGGRSCSRHVKVRADGNRCFELGFAPSFKSKRSCTAPTTPFLRVFTEHRLTICNSSIR